MICIRQYNPYDKILNVALFAPLTHKQLEPHGCVLNNVATDVLALKHQAISIYNADLISIVALNKYYTEILHSRGITSVIRLLWVQCCKWVIGLHYGPVIMDAIVSQITSLNIVYSIVYSDADQRKHQSSASLAFVRGIHRRPVNSPHKWPVTRKMFPFDDVIMRTCVPDGHYRDHSPGALSLNQVIAIHLKIGLALVSSTGGQF